MISKCSSKHLNTLFACVRKLICIARISNIYGPLDESSGSLIKGWNWELELHRYNAKQYSRWRLRLKYISWIDTSLPFILMQNYSDLIFFL